MKKEKLERLMDEYKAALEAASAAQQAISRLAAQLVPGASFSTKREKAESKNGAQHRALSQRRIAPPKGPSLSEIRTALENWDEARRETRNAFKALKSTGSACVPKPPNLRASDLCILKRAVSNGTFKTTQPPYSAVLELLAE